MSGPEPPEEAPARPRGASFAASRWARALVAGGALGAVTLSCQQREAPPAPAASAEAAPRSESTAAVPRFPYALEEGPRCEGPSALQEERRQQRAGGRPAAAEPAERSKDLAAPAIRFAPPPPQSTAAPPTPTGGADDGLAVSSGKGAGLGGGGRAASAAPAAPSPKKSEAPSSFDEAEAVALDPNLTRAAALQRSQAGQLAQLEGAVELAAPNCPGAEQLRESVCGLAERICELLPDNPRQASAGLPEAGTCEEAQRRCQRARTRYQEKCE